MSSHVEKTSKPYALLIGIDCYLPNRLPDGTVYGNLGGCVRDVARMQAFLTARLKVPEHRITKLTASNVGKAEPPEPRSQWPTYENMIAAFQGIADAAHAGDVVHIHYSGHGGRTPTLLPELKGTSGLDEALVPTDIGNAMARYLRDIELARLLHVLVEKGAIVSVVLDSCHSGGMTRGVADVAVRGVGTVDTTPRPSDSLAASFEELSETWTSLTMPSFRGVQAGSGWLPEPKGYVLLAACRASEEAHEFAFDDDGRNGALTWWLLDSLHDFGEGLSYKLLHDRILAKVHSQFQQQTPQLQGEGDRVVFGVNRVATQYAVPVMEVDGKNQRLLLNAGQAHGLRRDAVLAIYRRGAPDHADQGERLALVEISELGATESWARITRLLAPHAVEQGDQAVLLAPGQGRLVRQVHLVRRQDLPATVRQEVALRGVQKALVGNPWIEFAPTVRSVDYQVALDENECYEIWDPSGQPIQNLRPPLNARDSDAAANVVRRLVHLAKYHAIQQLNNHDPTSPLARKLVVELIGKRRDYDPADPFEPEPFEDPGHSPTMSVGEWTAVRVRNGSPYVLNITVVDLQPAWGAKQVYPSGTEYFVPLDPGQGLIIPLRASLPEGYEQGTDIVKVFATVGTTNFRWLELPSLDEPLRRTGVLRQQQPRDPLEQLLAAFTAETPPSRHLAPAAYPSKQWITAQVEVTISRQAASDRNTSIRPTSL